MPELPEYVGKEQFRSVGIPTPNNQMVSAASDSGEYPSLTVEPPVVVKAQVPVSGRGKKGGIVFANTIDEVYKEIDSLLNTTIMGQQIGKVIVEEQIHTTNELYIAVVADGTDTQPTLMFSTKGGENIETTIDSHIHSQTIDPLIGIYQYHIQEAIDTVAEDISISTQSVHQVAAAAWELFCRLDLRLLEINPLGVTPNGNLCALDAKCVIDSAARFRQTYDEVHSTLMNIEQRAADNEIDLRIGDGDIGIISNGAGMALATIDYIDTNTNTSFSGFVDTHGADFEKHYIEESLRYLSECGSQAVIVNIQGSLIDCVPPAEAVIKATEEGYSHPVVARFKGPNADEARRRCEEAGVTVVPDITKAILTAVKLRERHP